ncbi:hypothetical protein HIM_03916 [Hirsutella minnesotensis 3608]|uniref:Uncharacterized protein n=1 Tax=Hirsutella minnesotensis 3608 TaxID=1043627 RepID=A0A0F7ZQ39_9HYPO|nr:hypothetical protein HIM_03916 [Hirsutella minnesotensis 3608]
MATLASIPEVNTSLPNTHESQPSLHTSASFERVRPRSRVLVLSRRPTRVRHRVRHSSASREPPARSQRAPARSQHPASGRSRAEQQFPNGSFVTRQTRGGNTHRDASYCRRFDVTSSSHELETSLSSVDLDSFPLPPSNPRRLHNPRNSSRPDPGPTIFNSSKLAPPAESRLGEVVPPAMSRDINTRRHLGDSAVDVARKSRHVSIDSALVDAITRVIVQQFRLFSAIKHSDRPRTDSAKSSPLSRHDRETTSSCSSRQRTLDRFTRHLDEYAETVGAKGKTALINPNPATSGESLRTISALMPFRPEFRAAGLAVTSKDQIPCAPDRHSSTAIKQTPLGRAPEYPQDKYIHPSQMDGYQDGFLSTGANTEISFAQDQDMDEWRYALIDEAPKRKEKRRPKAKGSRKYCLPCFSADTDEHDTNADWAHFRPGPSKLVDSAKPAAGNGSTMPQPEKPLPSRPMAARISEAESSSQSPGRVPVRSEPRRNGEKSHTKVMSEPTPNHRTNGDRRGEPSQTSGVPSNTNRERLPAKTYTLFSSQTGYDRGLGEARSQSHQTRPNDGAMGSEPPTMRPWRSLSGLATGHKMPEPPRASAPKVGNTENTSALPRRRERQDTQVSKPQSFEPASRLVSNGYPAIPARNQRSSSARRTKRSLAHYDPDHIGICCRNSRGMTSTAKAPPNIPKRTSSIREAVNSEESDPDDRKIADRDVLRGLHVAASAACDEEVDAFVRGRTGLRIRRFLADLIALEAFGGPRPGEDGGRQIQRRRTEMRKLKQQLRRSRDLAASGGLI